MRSPDRERPCEACGQMDWLPRWSQFIVCRHCGLMTVAVQPSAVDIPTLYSESYFQGDEYIDYEADKPAHQRTLMGHLKRVRRRVPAGGRLLEIGCAYGFFLELIKEIYPGSVGLDVSVAAVNEATKRGLCARVGDPGDAGLDGSFDGACLWDTIEHLAKPLEVVVGCARLLRRGGHLFLSTGDFGSLIARTQGRRWRQIHPPTHLFYFTRNSLRQLCTRAGLEVLEFGTVTVHRRIGSSLQALERFHATSFGGRLARVLRARLPASIFQASLPLNLGDTLFLAARKP